eukprot:scaffold16642_cov59-Phaeocystis_antarctica.AAC.1
MALSFVTIHPSLNMTTRLVGPRPQPTTRTPWPLRPDLSSQRWRPYARPVLPLFRLYNIRGKTGYRLYTHSLSPSRPPNNTLNTKQQHPRYAGTSATHARADSACRECYASVAAEAATQYPACPRSKPPNSMNERNPALSYAFSRSSSSSCSGDAGSRRPASSSAAQPYMRAAQPPSRGSSTCMRSPVMASARTSIRAPPPRQDRQSRTGTPPTPPAARLRGHQSARPPELAHSPQPLLSATRALRQPLEPLLDLRLPAAVVAASMPRDDQVTPGHANQVTPLSRRRRAQAH